MADKNIKAMFIFEILGRPPEHIKKTLGELITKLGELSGIEISSELGIIKPDVLFFKKIIEILEENPDKLFFIDDNPIYIKAAEEAGIKSYLFNTINDINFLVTK